MKSPEYGAADLRGAISPWRKRLVLKTTVRWAAWGLSAGLGTAAAPAGCGPFCTLAGRVPMVRCRNRGRNGGRVGIQFAPHALPRSGGKTSRPPFGPVRPAGDRLGIAQLRLALRYATAAGRPQPHQGPGPRRGGTHPAWAETLSAHSSRPRPDWTSCGSSQPHGPCGPAATGSGREGDSENPGRGGRARVVPEC